MLVKRTICPWKVSSLFVYIIRLVSLANRLNMVSLADDVHYKLLDEAEYVEFRFMTRMEDSTDSRRELKEPR